MSRSAEFEGSRLESLGSSTMAASTPEIPALTKTQQKMLDLTRRTGSVDAARTIHNASLDYWEPSSVNEDLKLNTTRIKDIKAVSAHIAAQANHSLAKAGFPEEFSVWRAGDLRNEVVPVTTQKGGVGLFGPAKEYRIKRAHVLTHGEGFLGNAQTYAENELHVDSKNLVPVN